MGVVIGGCSWEGFDMFGETVLAGKQTAGRGLCHTAMCEGGRKKEKEANGEKKEMDGRHFCCRS